MEVKRNDRRLVEKARRMLGKESNGFIERLNDADQIVKSAWMVGSLR